MKRTTSIGSVRGLALAGAALLSGCAGTSVPEPKQASPVNWKTSRYAISFTPGPKDSLHTGKTFSYYRIALLDAPSGELTLPSAHSTGGFGTVTNPDPKNWIRLIEDPENSALVIEETIPNDCGPCTNYLLVEPDAERREWLQHRYFKLPERSSGTGGIDSAFPTITSLRDGRVEYQYPNSPVEQRSVRSLPTEAAPTPPG